MSDIDGVYNKDPKGNKDAELIEEAYDTDSLLEIDSRGKSNLELYGLLRKLPLEWLMNMASPCSSLMESAGMY